MPPARLALVLAAGLALVAEAKAKALTAQVQSEQTKPDRSVDAASSPD